MLKLEYMNKKSKKPPDIATIRYQIVPILQQEQVIKSAIFGSFATGNARSDSDLDLLVDLPSGKSLFDLAHLKIQLEEKLGRKVDIITYGSISPFLKDIILKEQVPLYGEGS